ncbi:carbohydrate ABC transporter membrane protein 2 (CUT1 family) [Dongia mobilis]|uniref:Carbohydrate ABC transporter membrane protein 2 (CUT1 family) n=1 Tax=Dongia mobilis TaxID=578943 RepID=A0A4R6WUN0_9PROT|nr:carbohydrate ABC transporter permease [Dongia mobilis]TDQ84119.1 carbohydrate ABC transporter membrane protein 2 (CUT1 family) [Dongia mobilis]
MRVRWGSFIPHLILSAFSLAILLPLVWIVRVSLTDKLTAYKIPPEIGHVGIENYIEIFSAYPFERWFLNSLFVALASTAISLPLATAMAYAFARFNTGGIFLRLGVLASQMLPPIILVLPLFTLFFTTGLMQTHLGLILAHLTISLPFLAWMLVSFFEGDSASLEEAARIDGATRWQAFILIAVPVAAPGILAAGLLGFILSWNEFLFALVLSGADTQTLPVGLASMETHAGVEIAPLAAATVLSLLPVFVLLPFLRKYLIKGLSLGALK